MCQEGVVQCTGSCSVCASSARATNTVDNSCILPASREGELLGRQAGGGVLGALLGVLARGGRPEVGEGRERDRDSVPAVASRHGELGLVAAARERDRASARTGVWRGHRAGDEADAEARVLRRGRADFQLERSGGGGGGVGEGAVRRRLDEARRLERWHVHHLAIHHAKGWHHAPDSAQEPTSPALKCSACQA